MPRRHHGPGSLRWLLAGMLCLAFWAVAATAGAAVVAADFDQDGVADHLVVARGSSRAHEPVTTHARLRAWLEYGERGVEDLPARVRAHLRIRGFLERTGAMASPHRAHGREKRATAKGPVKRRRHHRRSRGTHDIGRETHASSGDTNQAAPTGSDGISPPRRVVTVPTATGIADAPSDPLPSFARSARRASRAPPAISL